MTDAPTTLEAPPSRWARAGVRAQFFVSGALFATWGVHVPTVKSHYGLGEEALAVAMLAGGVGALLALSQAGRLVARYGPRRLTVVTGVLCAALISALLVSQTYAVLVALLLFYGGAASLMDVAINSEASELEHQAGRPLMSGFHALFSLGGMVGAALGGALLHAGFTATQHLLTAAITCAAVVVAGGAVMLRMRAAPSAGGLSLPRGALLWLGVLAALGLVAEGAMYDWSVLYLKQELRTDAGTASLAYASFSGAMAAARFGGDWVRARMTPVALLQASGALGAVGMLLALLWPHPVAALVGFALVGLGFANVVPVLFAAAARVPGVTAAHGIAAVSSVGYLGMMAGPPLIGVVAEHSSLSWGLSAVLVFALVQAAAAGRVLPRR